MWRRLFASNQAKWTKFRTIGSRSFKNYSSRNSYSFEPKMYPMILALPLPMLLENNNDHTAENTTESPSENTTESPPENTTKSSPETNAENLSELPKGTSLMYKVAVSTALAALVGISGYAAWKFCQVSDDNKSELTIWLESHRLMEILPALRDHGINELSDLEALESRDDIEEFVNELQLKVIPRNKFRKALMDLIPDNQVTKTDTTQTFVAEKSKKQHYLQVPQLDEIDISVKHRSIMMIGQTGSGKSTLLNSMVNYLWNVQYDDQHRYKLVYEKEISQAKSQTEDVAAYYLNPPALNYNLTVIDTPGFGDTRGLDRDQEITKNIKTFFEQKIQDIDAICFVVRAPQARLTSTQKYIFHQVLSIFGNDIKENIFVLLTFADDKKPPALAALEADDVPYEQYFKLNNCAFGLDDHTDEGEDAEFDFGEGYWRMGVKSFEKLFHALDKVETKSLTLTKQVLTRREQLETYIESIQPTINQGYAVLEGIRKQIYEVNKYSDLIDANKNFEMDVEITKARKHKTNNNTTTCIQCKYTCHNNCGISKDTGKEGCVAMNDNGECTVCPARCPWIMHKNLKYIYEYYTVKEKKTIEDLKKKYYDAQNQRNSISQQILDGLENKLTNLNEVLDGSINGVRECINELSEIALRPVMLSQDDYIDKLIESEELQKQSGWQHRCSSLRELKEKHEMLKDINSEEYNPWKKYEDVEQYAKKNLVKGNKADKYWFMGIDQF